MREIGSSVRILDFMLSIRAREIYSTKVLLPTKGMSSGFVGSRATPSRLIKT